MTNLISEFSGSVGEVTSGIYQIAEAAIPIVIAGIIVVLAFKFIKRLSKAA